MSARDDLHGCLTAASEHTNTAKLNLGAAHKAAHTVLSSQSFPTLADRATVAYIADCLEKARALDAALARVV